MEPKPYPKSNFDIIKDTIDNNCGGLFGYHVFSSEDPITKKLFKHIKPYSAIVATSTGTNTLLQEYKCENFTAAKGESSIVLWYVRYDDSHHNGTSVHWNNEYFALVPSPRGQILQIKLNNLDIRFNKHYIKLFDNAEINKILASVLPSKKSGSIGEFYSNSKSPYVDIKPINEKEGE